MADELNISDDDTQITDERVDESDVDRGDELTPEQRGEQPSGDDAGGDAGDGDQAAAGDAAGDDEGGAGGEADDAAAAGDDAGDAGDGQAGDAAAAPQMIPKSRFDEVNNERKWLREQLEAARGGTAKEADPKPPTQEAEPFDVDKAEREYMDAFMDGDTDKAIGIRKQINAEIHRQALADSEASAGRRQQQESVRATAENAYQKYPFLNHEGDQANSEAINEVVLVRDGYRAQGYSDADSLRLAVDRVGPRYAPADTSPPKPGTDKPGDAAARDTRNRDAVRRNAETARQAPPQIAGKGARGEASEMPRVEDMSDEEFHNLSDAEKSRLRGD